MRSLSLASAALAAFALASPVQAQDVSGCFVRTDSCKLEQQMVRKVLDEVKSRNAPPATVEACARELASLLPLVAYR